MSFTIPTWCIPQCTSGDVIYYPDVVLCRPRYPRLPRGTLPRWLLGGLGRDHCLCASTPSAWTRGPGTARRRREGLNPNRCPPRRPSWCCTALGSASCRICLYFPVWPSWEGPSYVSRFDTSACEHDQRFIHNFCNLHGQQGPAYVPSGGASV